MIKKPINIHNGLKIELNENAKLKNKPKSNLIAINFYQNSKNISKPFIKPISKII